MNVRTLQSIFAATAVLTAALPARAQHAEAQMTAMNPSDMKLTPFPGMPTCATGAVMNGDPAKGASTIYAKLAPKCVFPWHWHTPNEHVMVVSGEGLMEMKDGKPATLKAGGFAMMPSRHVHQFSCKGGCTLFVFSDVAFDMHYVDADGKELSPEDALKAVKETPAKAPEAAGAK